MFVQEPLQLPKFAYCLTADIYTEASKSVARRKQLRINSKTMFASDLPNSVSSPSSLQAITERLLSNELTTNHQEIISLLEQIDERVYDISYAKKFYHSGGYAVIKRFASAKEPRIRELCGAILAHVLQQNGFCQQKALDDDMLFIICQLLEDDLTEVKRNGMLALSALLRSCPSAVAKFDALNGFAKLRITLEQCETDKIFEARVWFMLNALSRESIQNAFLLVQHNVHEDAYELLASQTPGNSCEHISATMVNLLQKASSRISLECIRKSFNIVELISSSVANANALEALLAETISARQCEVTTPVTVVVETENRATELARNDTSEGDINVEPQVQTFAKVSHENTNTFTNAPTGTYFVPDYQSDYEYEEGASNAMFDEALRTKNVQNGAAMWNGRRHGLFHRVFRCSFAPLFVKWKQQY